MPDTLLPRDPNRHPPALTPGYKSSTIRAPRQALVAAPQSLGDVSGPAFGHEDIGPLDADLLHNHAQPGESALGERIVLHGRVLDENARPIPNTLIEIWQANGAGRYRHSNDGYVAPLDPNFGGCGRTLTDAEGRYSFRTVKPGAYPWPNWQPAWRPAHIHLSVFGTAFAQRLITQCYFEGDPLIPLCPIANTVPDPDGVSSLTAKLDMDAALPFDALAYRFDIVLRGHLSTPFENRPEGN